MADRPWMRRLADRAGIIPQYIDCAGRVQYARDLTCELLLAALGHEASTEDAAERSLRASEREEDGRILEPVHIAGGSDDRPVTLHFKVPASWSGRVEWNAALHFEDGSIRRLHGCSEPDQGTRVAAVPLGDRPAIGYHDVHIQATGSGQSLDARQTLIVAPPRCAAPEDRLGPRRGFGICCNLYTLRSQSNWGIGNVRDLTALAEWAAGLGADFVGLNPLHALGNRGHQICPYQPVSRLFRNVLYLDIAAIPELAATPEANRWLESAEFRERLRSARRDANLPYDEIAALYRTVLDPLHRTFCRLHRDQDTPRGRDYRRFQSTAPLLEPFATYLALDEHFRSRGLPGGWPTWPAPCRRADSAQVAEFQKDQADAVSLHCYCQFELDRQLAASAVRARAAGLAVGLYADLALGTAATGFDAWFWPQLFVTASIGAPPDPLAPGGQEWGLPPLHPRRLRDGAYVYWTHLLRAAMAHVGALRVDHVMGLGRQYWIPAGQPGSAGAYVRYPQEELLAVLALESHRHRVVVVGEDLGTVEPGFRELLARWGLLSSQVLYLQRDGAGEFVPACHYAQRALATVNTHDMAPLAGFLQGEDLALRRDLGEYAGPEQFAAEEARRRSDLAALRRRLQSEGLLGGEAEPSYDDWCRAVHAFLGRTPSRLVGVSLDDLAGETVPVNVPGVGPARRLSWSRRMSRDLHDLISDPRVCQQAAAALAQG